MNPSGVPTREDKNTLFVRMKQQRQETAANLPLVPGATNAHQDSSHYNTTSVLALNKKDPADEQRQDVASALKSAVALVCRMKCLDFCNKTHTVLCSRDTTTPQPQHGIGLAGNTNFRSVELVELPGKDQRRRSQITYNASSIPRFIITMIVMALIAAPVVHAGQCHSVLDATNERG